MTFEIIHVPYTSLNAASVKRANQQGLKPRALNANTSLLSAEMLGIGREQDSMNNEQVFDVTVVLKVQPEVPPCRSWHLSRPSSIV